MSMPYTYASFFAFCAIVFGLFALIGSGLAAGPWVLVALVLAFALPALILKSRKGWTL
jgi:Flp pilus assembly protein TadB